MKDSQNLFPFLATGLAQYTKQAEKYPYPHTFQFALNQLAGVLKEAMPVSMTGTLR